jgi:hypothetical protein
LRDSAKTVHFARWAQICNHAANVIEMNFRNMEKAQHERDQWRIAHDLQLRMLERAVRQRDEAQAALQRGAETAGDMLKTTVRERDEARAIAAQLRDAYCRHVHPAVRTLPWEISRPNE